MISELQMDPDFLARIVLWRIVGEGTTQIQEAAEIRHRARHALMSPDGTLIIACDGAAVYVWRVNELLPSR